MRPRFFVALCMALSIGCHGQNLVLKTAHPKAGEVIEIEYTPAGNLASTTGKVEAATFMHVNNNRVAEELKLVKSGKKYLAKIPTDTSVRLVQLSFFVGDKFDNNFNEGYYIQLYQGDKIRKGSYAQLAALYQFFGYESGIEKDDKKALVALEKELELYPEQKKTLAPNYYRIATAVRGDQSALILKDIENALKDGLQTEADYLYVESLYNAAKLPDQAKVYKQARMEKFPNGKYAAMDLIQKYQATKDTIEKEKLFADIETKVRSNPEWKDYQWVIDNHAIGLAVKFARRKDWTGYKSTLNQIKNTGMVASNYNSMAWSLQEKNEDLAVAEDLSRFASEYARKEYTNPTGTRPSYLTPKRWQEDRQDDFTMYADTYAMVLYKLGKNKEGLIHAKEAALDIKKGVDRDLNTTYALLAEKTLPKADVKAQLEKFVKDGKSTSTINDILKKLYINDRGNDQGFEAYMTALANDAKLKMIEDLRRAMYKEQAPSVPLKDLTGKEVSISDLRGKIVVLDFWATWCGPCKASFPGMQKMVTKYQNDANVKFVFVDTWEKADNKEKNASDFIASNKYTFDVWMDNADELVSKFKVEGIPTKFVIDTEGNIRFKSVGFGGGDDHLIEELTAMIELVSQQRPTN